MLVCLVLPWKGVVGMETKKNGGEGGGKNMVAAMLEAEGKDYRAVPRKRGVNGLRKRYFFVWYTSVEIGEMHKRSHFEIWETRLSEQPGPRR